jgi:hypothetical protein
MGKHIKIFHLFRFRPGSVEAKFSLLLNMVISANEMPTFSGKIGEAFVKYLKRRPDIAAQYNIDPNSIQVTGRYWRRNCVSIVKIMLRSDTESFSK